MLLIGCGLVAGLLLVELAVRVATGTLVVAEGPDSEDYRINDPLVGRIPRPGVSFHHPTKGFSITIGANGTRNNGGAAPRAERPLTLAVGDSFAFGDEVDDADSWPAVLERALDQPVLNAAVPGFGLDQAVLRAEQLAGVYQPDTIIVSFIPHDVTRCEMSYWSGNAKPYFEIDASGLRLHPAPVPPADPWAPLKHVLSASMTLDLLFPRFLHWHGPDTWVHDRGQEVACRLMERLAALAEARHARVVILAQPQVPTSTRADVEIKDAVLACAAANHLLTLDLFPVIDALPAEQRARLFHGHMTVEGNRLVAAELAAFMQRAGAPYQSASGGARGRGQ